MAAKPRAHTNRKTSRRYRLTPKISWSTTMPGPAAGWNSEIGGKFAAVEGSDARH